VAKRSKIDINRVAAAAMEAAFEDEQHQPRRRMSGVTAVAAGAALVAVGRVAAKKVPKVVPSALLPSVPSLSDLTGGVRDRLAEYGWIEEEEPLDDEEEPLDEADELLDDDDEEEEPRDEAEEWDEPEDEEDEGSEGGEDDEWDDEDDDETDDDEPQGSGDDEPEEVEEDDAEPDEEEEEESAPALELGSNGGGGDTRGRAPDLMSALTGHRRPPVMRSGDRGRRPAAEPPEPPKKRQRSTSKSKSKTGRS
jgi:hypothetical protein